MALEFTKAECQLIALLKILNGTGLVTKHELQDMAIEFVMLRLAMSNRDIDDALEVLKRGGGPEELGLDQEDHKWFMTLHTLANPGEVMTKMGYKDIDDLKASIKRKRKH